MADRESTAVGYRIRGIQPADLAQYPDSVKLMYWGWVVQYGLRAKDKDLAADLDKNGSALKPSCPSQSSGGNRRLARLSRTRLRSSRAMPAPASAACSAAGPTRRAPSSGGPLTRSPARASPSPSEASTSKAATSSGSRRPGRAGSGPRPSRSGTRSRHRLTSAGPS